MLADTENVDSRCRDIEAHGSIIVAPGDQQAVATLIGASAFEKSGLPESGPDSVKNQNPTLFHYKFSHCVELLAGNVDKVGSLCHLGHVDSALVAGNGE